MRIGPYEVTEELARGAQGAVYQARDSRSGRVVALKQVRPQNPRVRRRFETEVTALGRLQHPTLVQIYEHGDDPGGPWVAQELVEGHSLQHRLRRWGRFGVAESARIVAALARGLDYAHQSGVLHRDVKPDNVLLRPDGRPVLVDFGVAQDLNDAGPRLSRTGEFLGSPGYWAPEQAQGALRDLGPATDVYGLGATLYALLSGHPPIEAQTLASFLDLSRFGEITPLPDLNPEVPGPLWAVVARCLEVDPGARFPSASALAEALEPFAQATAATSARAHLWVAGALLALLLAAGVGLWTWRGERGPAPPPPPQGADMALEALLARAGEAFANEDLPQVYALLDEAEALAPRDARVWSKRGVAMILEKRFQEARRAMQRALELDPDSPLVQRNWGSMGVMLGDYDMAVAGFERALELNPQETGALHGLALAYKEQGRLAEAERILNRALVLDTSHAPSWSRRGELRLNTGDLLGALEDFQQAVNLDPDDPVYRLWFARGLLKANALEQALEQADEALRLDPDSETAPRLKLDALTKLGRASEAEDLADSLLQRAPNDAKTLLERGNQRYKRGDAAGALRDVERALELEPDNPEMLIARGSALMHVGRAQEAAESTRRAIERRPTSVLAHANLAAQLILLDDVEGAERAGRRALELDPSHVLARQNLAAVLLRSTRPREAKELLDALCAEGHDDPLTLDLLGATCLDLGQRAEAERVFRLCLERSQGLRLSTRCGLARTLAELGQLAEAHEQLAACLALAPTNSTVLLTQARVRMAEGDLDSARAACREGLAHESLPGSRRLLEECLAEIEAQARGMDERTGPR